MAEGAAPSDGHCHGVFPSNLGQDNKAQEIQPRDTLRDAHGREEHDHVMDRPPSSSTKSLGKAIQDYDEEHERAAPSTKLIPKAKADNMTHVAIDDLLKSTPIPKKNQLPQTPSYLNDTRDHSPSRDEGRVHDPRTSNYAQDDNTQTGDSSTNRSTGVVRAGITSPCDAELAIGTTPKTKSLGKVIQDGITAELAKGTAAASSPMKSVILVDPKKGKNINSLGGPSASMMSPTKAVPDAPGSEKHALAVAGPPSSRTKSLGKAIEAYDQEHAGAASSTKIIPKANADAGPSVRAPAQHHEEVVAAIGGLAQANAGDFASNAARPIPAIPEHDVNVAIAAIGGGDVVVGPAPAQINGRGIVVVAARAAPVAIPVPVLPPNPGVNNIDPLTNSGIRPLRNPSDGDEGKIWDKLN